MLTAYLWAAGPEFDAKRFLNEHRDAGSLRETKVMEGTRVVPGPLEWESPRLRVPDHVPTDEAISRLLMHFGPFIDDAKSVGATEIFLQFVGRFVDRDARGLHLSPEMMRLLVERGVSVDYDVVRTAQAA